MNIRDFFKSDKAVKLITLCGIGLMVLIFILSLTGGDKEEVQQPQTDIYQYEEKLEQQLEEILKKISGVGEVKVMITLEKTEETVYSDRESSVETTITPTVRGAVVYCAGSENPLVKQRVLEAVSRALGVGVNKVCVTY